MTLTGQERQISLLQGTFFPAKMATEWVSRFRKEGAGAILQFEIAAAKENPTMAHLDQSAVEPRKDNYVSAAQPNGQWLMLSATQ